MTFHKSFVLFFSLFPFRSHCWPALLTAGLVVLMFLSQAQAQNSDEDKAGRVAMTALQAQNAKEFEFAATEWKRLIKDHPNCSIVDKAYFNLGICFIQMQQYEQAIEQFKAAVPLLKDKQVQVPTARFYMGYAQYELGSSKLSGGSDEKEQATELLTTATQTLAQILKDSPDFERNDSVCYFRGGAYEKLGRLEEALEAYLQMANYKSTDKTYRFDSLFAICDLHFALGQYDKALKATQRFVAAAKPVNHPLLDRVNLLQGKVHVNLAVAAQGKRRRQQSERTIRPGRANFAEHHFGRPHPKACRLCRNCARSEISTGILSESP